MAPRSEVDGWVDENGEPWADENGQKWVPDKSSSWVLTVTNSSQSQELRLRGKAGGVVGFVSDVATQVAFGDSTVAIGTDDPLLPANRVFYFIPTGTHIAFKCGTSGTAQIWNAGLSR